MYIISKEQAELIGKYTHSKNQEFNPFVMELEDGSFAISEKMYNVLTQNKDFNKLTIQAKPTKDINIKNKITAFDLDQPQSKESVFRRVANLVLPEKLLNKNQTKKHINRTTMHLDFIKPGLVWLMAFGISLTEAADIVKLLSGCVALGYGIWKWRKDAK